jgi:hypothetical protein
MAGRLVERRDGQAGTGHVLGPSVTSIGRSADNDIVVASPYVSHHHAQVCWDGTRYALTDLSRNGTYLNGVRVADAQELRPGDAITLPGDPPLVLVFETRFSTLPWTMEEASPREAVREHVAAGRDASIERATQPVPLARPRCVRIDPATAEVWVRGESVRMRRKEYLALTALAEKDGALVTRDELTSRVWPEYASSVTDDDVAEVDPGRPQHLLTVRGLGYRLVLK